MTPFDPYYKWLSIPPAEQPANHYRLLGVNLFEPDPDVIQSAADQRMTHLRSFQIGEHSELSQRLLNELAAAKICLLRHETRATYDAGLRARLALATPRQLFPLVQAAPPPAPIPLPSCVTSDEGSVTAQPKSASPFDFLSQDERPSRRRGRNKSLTGMALPVVG